jgi:hypothetical protein
MALSGEHQLVYRGYSSAGNEHALHGSGAVRRELLAELAAVVRGRCAAVMLTAALPLLPGYLVAGGVAHVVSARSETQLVELTGRGPFAQRLREFGERAPTGDVPSQSATDLRREMLRRDPQPSEELSWLTLSFLAGWGAAFVFFTIGLFLAQTALLPVVAGCSRPADAWAAVAARSRLLLGTTALAILLIVVGLAFFAVPGLILAVGFSFAGPVVLAEGSAGCGALERSWRLMRWAWRPQLVIVFVGALTTVGIRWALWRYWPVQSLPGRVAFSAMVCALTLPFAAAASAILYVHTRKRYDGTNSDELCRKIRQIAVPPVGLRRA